VPEKIQADTKYCANLWEQWVKHRAETTGDVIPHLRDIKVKELLHWLCAFALEVRKKMRNEFVPNTLHHICAEL